MVRKEKSKRTQKIIITLFLAALMVTSILGIMTSQSGVISYNGIKFYDKDNYFSAKINGQDVYFNFHPEQVASLELSDDADRLLKNSYSFYVTYDLNTTSPEYLGQVQYDLVQFLPINDIYAMPALTSNSTYSVPVITCENSTQAEPVIYLTLGNITNISLEGRCITATAKTPDDLLYLRDRILFSALDIA